MNTKAWNDFLNWYKSSHGKNEDAYKDIITKESIEKLDRDGFIQLFTEFYGDGGKVQSGGHRNKGKFKSNILENKYESFRAFTLEAFEKNLDVIDWLNRLDDYKSFGVGIATIFLNRVNKEKYVIVNDKTIKGLNSIGLQGLKSDVTYYEKIRDIHNQLISETSLENYYQTDALMHFIGKPEDGGEALSQEIKKILSMGKKENANKHLTGDGKGAGLNQILYGPPGTGKTFYTVKKAVGICDGKVSGNYEEAKKRYQELKSEGRIEFVTFHQSYGYEEFIEGIRADTDAGKVSYKKVDGVFKRCSINALFDAYRKSNPTQSLGFYELYSRMLADFQLNEELSLKSTTDKTIEVRAISKAENLHCYHEDSDKRYTVGKDRLKKLYEVFDTLEKLENVKNLNSELTEVIGGANQTVYWSALYYLLKLKDTGQASAKENIDQVDIHYEAKKDWLNEQKIKTFPKDARKHVLIIDEINRGNMSKIFGELITLIEDDKRIGASNEMTVRLPVSGDEFGVPSNLYIIGTMNTADRSIAMMDTALRRRFEFEEMMPKASLLKEIFVDGVDVEKLLKTINQRIEVLYDREHTIGHAYFMGLNSESKIENLGRVFANKVIPLLAEYFFEDWEKIRMVLGDNQKADSAHHFIVEKKKVDHTTLFGSDESDIFDEQRKVYERNPEALNKPESYMGIYQPKEINNGSVKSGEPES